MGQDVHHVPTIKNPSAYRNSLINLCHSWCTIWYMVHINIFGPLFPPVDSLIYSPVSIGLRGGQKPFRSLTSWQRRAALAFVGSWIGWFGVPLTLSRQGTPVWVKLVKGTDALTWFKACLHHRIPSKLQRPRGTVPPPAQGFTQCSHWPISLVWKFNSGSPWHLNRAKRGCRLHCHRTGVWYHPTTTSWIFQ